MHNDFLLLVTCLHSQPFPIRRHITTSLNYPQFIHESQVGHLQIFQNGRFDKKSVNNNIYYIMKYEQGEVKNGILLSLIVLHSGSGTGSTQPREYN
jgi:hypothetical protein